MNRFIRNSDIELRAEEVLTLYEKKHGTIAHPPVPIEKVVMQVFGLTVDWDEIEEEEGIIVFGGLNPKRKVIVLNSRQLDLFHSSPGLERSTIGHEAGHWEYEVDKNAIDHPTLPGFEEGIVFLHKTSRKYGTLTVYRGNIQVVDNKKVRPDLLRKYDDKDQARVVNRFAAALSMPRHLLKEAVKGVDLTKWTALYDLKETFDVSISAMSVRLQQLGYIYIDGKVIHKNKLEAFGQETLGL